MISKSKKIEIIPEKLIWISLKTLPKNLINAVFFRTDLELTYNSINYDFGPLSLDKIIPFINGLERILKINKCNNKIIYYYTDLKKENRCNSAFLMACFMIIKMKLNSIEIWNKFSKIEPRLEKFRDSYHGNRIYDMSLFYFFRAVEYSVKLKFFNPFQFDANNYEFYGNIKNGHINWIINKKILIFCSPNNHSEKFEKIYNIKAENFIPFFKNNKIELIIRLNKETYNKNIFLKAGIKHKDLYLKKNTKPSFKQIKKFLNLIENTKGAIAIHSKTGLGRASLLVALALIFIYKFSPENAIAWLRICRSGSILGKQKDFLLDIKKYKHIFCHGNRFINSLNGEERKWIDKFN